MGKDLNGKELGKGFRQRANGLYEARFSANKKSYSFYSDDLEELKKKLEYEKKKANTDIVLFFGNSTLDEWFEEWFKTYKQKSIKVSSVAPMRRKYTNSFGRILGKRKLVEIMNIDVQRAVNQLHKEGKSKATISESLGRLRECFDSAKNNGIVSYNPCNDIVLPRMEEKKKERRFLSKEEQVTFLNAASDTWYKEMFYIMFLTGMRVGEVGALKWSDIDFQKKEIHVRRNLMCQYDKGVKTLSLIEPKTANSIRTIPFFGEAEEMFLSQKDKQEKRKRELGDRWRSKFDNLVFCTSLGSECTRYIIEKETTKVTDRINKHERFENMYPHAIRHTFCSRCYECGIDVKVTQKLMGHSSISITLDYYTHLSGLQFEDAVKKFGRINE